MIHFPKEYTLIKEDVIEEIEATGYLLHHKKSQAHLFLIEADDSNKVFDIAFKTVPQDDTGVAHIMEHSVLCGSERYPLKDPFIELAKGSLNTFLNAMTYPEKTMYPVASTNQKDFMNLMSVYMDAVFHPNIYTNEKIFMQEGWHYELDDVNAPLKYNGVVYNEMRGAFSDPDGVMERINLNTLFPDTNYQNESGGDPKAIPSLTYADFIAFHKRFYHPSNSYIYLYGDMNFEEVLNFLDKEYLSHYDAIDPQTEIAIQKPFEKMADKTFYYGVSDKEEEKEGAIFAYSKVTNGLFDPVETIAYEVLSYALLNAPGAPVKKALIDAGIGVDIYGGSDSSVRQPMFSVFAKGAKKKDYKKFKEIIEKTLAAVIKKGIPEKTLCAAIHNIEFSMREADFGRMPQGLVYGLSAYETWIHDEMTAMVNLKYNSTLASIKEKVGTDYFVNLIQTALLDNPHGATIALLPKVGLTKENDDELEKKLAAYKASLSKEDLKKIVENTKALKAYQDEPTAKEDLEKIPLLDLVDISRNPAPVQNEEMDVCGLPTVFHETTTSGILYVDIFASLKQIDLADFPYVGLLTQVLSMMDTKKHTYQELSDEISLKTGGIGYALDYTNRFDTNELLSSATIGARCLYDEVPEMMKILTEITFETDFSDAKRLKEIIAEIRSDMQDALVSNGHRTALSRVFSYTSDTAAIKQLTGGIDYFRFVCDLEKHFDEKKEAIIQKLQTLNAQVFAKENLLVSITSEKDGLEKYKDAVSDFVKEANKLPKLNEKAGDRTIIRKAQSEGFMTSSQVQYVAMGGQYPDQTFRLPGSALVLKVLMSYEYLWQNIRVKGGAYGCMNSYTSSREIGFVSYRDPNLKNTAAIYEAIPDYIRTLSIDARDIQKYIIGAIGEADTPMQPHAKGLRSMNFYLTGETLESVKKRRAEVLDCTLEDLRALGDVIGKVLSNGKIAVIGNSEKIKEDQALFETITTLSGEEV